MLQGRALQFHIKTLHLQQQALPASNTEIQVCAPCHGWRASSSPSWVHLSTRTRRANRSQTTRNERICTSPSSATMTGVAANAAQESLISWQVQIGPKNYPEASPCSNLAESFSLLRQAVGVYDESIRTTSIHEEGYRGNQFVIGGLSWGSCSLQ